MGCCSHQSGAYSNGSRDRCSGDERTWLIGLQLSSNVLFDLVVRCQSAVCLCADDDSRRQAGGPAK